MCYPTIAGKSLVKNANRPIVGHGERDVRGIPDRRVRQVSLGPGHASVGGTPYMESINVALAPVIRPADIHRGTVVRIDGYGKRRTDALLPQGRRIRPRNGDALDHDPPRQFVRGVLQSLEGIGTRSSGIVPHHDNVTSRNRAVEFSPAKEGCVNGVVGRNRRTNGWTILSRGLSR